MTSFHLLSGRAFDTLSRGRGDATSIRTLADAQLSNNLLLIRYLTQAWTVPAQRDAAVDVLAEAQAQDPDAVRDLLVQPMIAAWAAHTARQVRGTAPTPIGDLGHLSAIAAVAAVRCGIEARLTVAAHDGQVHLPTMGAALLPSADGEIVELIVKGGQLSVVHGGGSVVSGAESPGWLVSRQLVGTGLPHHRVTLDDLDPYRGGYHVRVAERLDRAAVDAWQLVFEQAWTLLTTHAPDRAAEISCGLRTMVPLVDMGDGTAKSATPRDTFGGFGLTLPGTAVDMATSLVHEFQHSKLNAILDLVKLHEPTRAPTFFAPWRADPRPISGLYQGVYAFIGVADTWRHLLGAPGLENVAERNFAAIREQVHCGLSTLQESDVLTNDGRRFAAGLRRTVNELYAIELPPRAVAAARDALHANRTAWRTRNGRTD
jgi:HEXXH motif-containing protein